MIGYASSGEPVLIVSGKARLAGVLEFPRKPCGMVLCAQCGASQRMSAHESYLTEQFRRADLASLRLDLLSPDEGGGMRRIDLVLLCKRLAAAADWLAAEPETKTLALGLFGGGGEIAAALQLAARQPARIAAIVSRGGRPDLAGPRALAQVHAPTLLIVGEKDQAIIEHNRRALDQLGCEKDLAVIRGATYPNEEQRALPEVARLAARWFKGYFGSDTRSPTRDKTPKPS